jgi:hypothetical protein
LKIPKKYVFTDLDEAPELLTVILDSQQKKIDTAEGADKVEQFCVIFDDVIGHVSFMNNTAFTRCFYQVRHVNCTTFICTQHFKRVPKVCRLQANFVFFFQGSSGEVEVIVDEYAPPMYSRDEFRRIVNQYTNGKHMFLTINNKIESARRFRQNLGTIIRLDRLKTSSSGDGTEGETKEEGERGGEEEEATGGEEDMGVELEAGKKPEKSVSEEKVAKSWQRGYRAQK